MLRNPGEDGDDGDYGVIVDELEVDDQGDDDDVDVDDVVGELELDDQGRALFCEH